VNMNFCFL